MLSLVEIKRQGNAWERLIMEKDSLPFCMMEDQAAEDMLNALCESMSSIGPNELFNPLEVTNDLINRLDEGDYNANSWSEMNDIAYDLVNSFADVVLPVIKEYTNIALVCITDVSVEVQFQVATKEYF